MLAVEQQDSEYQPCHHIPPCLYVWAWSHGLHHWWALFSASTPVMELREYSCGISTVYPSSWATLIFLKKVPSGVSLGWPKSSTHPEINDCQGEKHTDCPDVGHVSPITPPHCGLEWRKKGNMQLPELGSWIRGRQNTADIHARRGRCPLSSHLSKHALT